MPFVERTIESGSPMPRGTEENALLRVTRIGPQGIVGRDEFGNVHKDGSGSRLAGAGINFHLSPRQNELRLIRAAIHGSRKSHSSEIPDKSYLDLAGLEVSTAKRPTLFLGIEKSTGSPIGIKHKLQVSVLTAHKSSRQMPLMPLARNRSSRQLCLWSKPIGWRHRCGRPFHPIPDGPGGRRSARFAGGVWIYCICDLLHLSKSPPLPTQTDPNYHSCTNNGRPLFYPAIHKLLTNDLPKPKK